MPKPSKGLVVPFLVLLIVLPVRAQQPGSAVTTGQPTTVDLDRVPLIDTTLHSVPLEEVYFDTFRAVNRVIPLSEASNTLILKLRDYIPPIYEPVFESVEYGDAWLADSDIVVGYVDRGEAYAYPVRILNWHEMVSHEVAGQPIVATY